jgi:L-iditol 2-dehydrogenase
MRVAALSDVESFELVDRPRPEPGPDQALVAVREVGICGSDVHYYERGENSGNVVDFPFVLGHESAGVVVETGEEVTGLEPGDRVAIEPGVPCRRCERCKAGEYHLCDEVTFMASPPDDGALAEYVAWPADFLHELPDDVSLREGALCEPLSVGVHACRRGEVGVGDSVLITGAGPIGLVAMEAARAAGATEVLISDVVEGKLDLAAERGADRTIDATEEDLAEAVADRMDGRGVDVAIEASGADPAIRSTIDAVRRGGTVVFVGLSPNAEIPLDHLAIIDRELDVRGSFRYANTYPAAIDLLADGTVDVVGLVDFEYPLVEAGTAFRRALESETVKGMIRVGAGED